MYRDAYITEVMITLKGTYGDRMEEALKQLRGVGMHVDNADQDMSMVEGSIEAGSVHALEQLDAVQYVRKMHTYAAEYPAGDPRDRNKDEGKTSDVLPPAPTRRLGKRYP
jgi:hypothetical protein